MPDSSIEEYKKKRRFERTPEPAPGAGRTARGVLTFVIQKHRASHLHYDFRLEVDGVMKSWAVPKGPSLDPGEKRLAVQVEDHPLDYASFEGAIPEGEYGAGEVIVWDAGTYWPDAGKIPSPKEAGQAQEEMRDGLASGKLSIFLQGEKLQGSWALVKMKQGDRNWLLIKHQDEFADPDRDVMKEDRSVLSDRSIEEITGGRAAKKAPARSAVPRRVAPRGGTDGAGAAAMPESFPPMLASLTERPFSNPRWIFEPKLDGVRAIARIQDGRVRLFSRSRLEDTARYPSIVEHLRRQKAREMVLDGEIVAPDEEGRPSFQLLQSRMHLSREADIRRAEVQTPVLYYVFDILYLDGRDLRGLPLEERKGILKQAVAPSEQVRLVEFFEGEGEAAYEAIVAQGLEGVIAKRRDSTYQSGRRSPYWLKAKAVLSDEFIIGGFSRGAGARAPTFGSLLLGQRDEKGRLIYASNVGTGFDDRLLIKLRRRLDDLRTPECPFAKKPQVRGEAIWVRPELVAEVKFSSWTKEGSLRAPVFMRLREDKPVEQVIRADVVAPPDRREPGQEPSAEASIAGILDQLSHHGETLALNLDGEKLPLRNLNKEFWPAQADRPAVTKRDFLLYLLKASRYLLPHLKDRPLTLTRYPGGVQGKHFFQKHWEGELPRFVETVRLYGEHNGGDSDYLLCNNLETLLWLGQLADLEFHPWYSRVNPDPDGADLPRQFAGSVENIESSLLNYPDFVVFDIDPYIYSGQESQGAEPELNRRAFEMTCQVALWLKELLDSLGVPSFVKTSGKTGLHVYLPIRRRLDFESVHAIARTLGETLVKQHPHEVTVDWAVAKRSDKIFFDYNQNLRGKTLASIYSPRATPQATVSMPLEWEELGSVYPTDFTIFTAPDRLAAVGDKWSGILTSKQDLAGILSLDSGRQRLLR